MLRELHIENIAVIETLDVSFDSGLTALTGETGAGKSILIDSIGMLLGSRTSRDIVRTGCDKAFVGAAFDNSFFIRQKLAEIGIEADDDIILVSRDITADGRSSARINGRQVTSSILRDIGASLINIHGQHDNITLLDPAKHLPMLDSFAGDISQREAYVDAYIKAEDIRKRIKALSVDDREKEARTDLLKYQIKELEDADLRQGEEEELEKRKSVLVNKEKIIDGINRVCELLSEGETNIRDMLSDAVREISSVERYDEALVPIAEKLDTAYSALEDSVSEIFDYRDGSDYSLNELDDIEQRLDIIYKFKRKYGSTIEQMLDYLEKARKELDEMEFSGEKLEKLNAEYSVCKAELDAKAATLTAVRTAAAKDLAKRICEELSFLDMPKVVFEVSIRKKELDVTGADDVEFLISANVGQEPRPLSKIASGGELSRIMLAVKNILNQNDVQTLIFDEIDTGVSGSAAQKIAIKLRQMSKSAQVIVVTHLPQIASYADEHFKIIKENGSA
ncbi:MAG: DNA repair protein RecN, partial [Eubacteriales bacterium]